MYTMYTEWLAIEHYRLHLIEEWPEGARKAAGLAAVRAALDSLERNAPNQCSNFKCAVCCGRSAAPLKVAA